MPVLPQKIYETLRWLLWIVVPAGLTTFGAISMAVGLDEGTIALVTLIATSVSTFFGIVLGISKYTNDKE